MTNERLILAIGQIERALSRMESAQDRFATNMGKGSKAAESSNADSQDMNALQDRYEALREATGQAMQRIDTLIKEGR